MSRLSALVLVSSLILLPRAASASTIVVPNANAATEGNDNIFGPFQSGDITFQWLIGASQFSGIAPGTLLAAIGFRLDAGDPALPTIPMTYGEWDLELSSSLHAIGSLSSTFDDNIAANGVTVRSGPLTIQPNDFTGGAGPNSFFFVTFSAPFVYTGGDLLVTLRHDAADTGFASDGVRLASISGIGDTLLANDFASPTGQAEAFNMPVTAFRTGDAAVPEPMPLVLVATGLAFVILRRRR